MNIYALIYIRIYNKTYMSTIITTSQVQKKIGKITSSIGKKSYIVTNRGEGKIVMLPYFEGCDEFIEDYMEDYEMLENREKLTKEAQKSLDSGLSDLKI